MKKIILFSEIENIKNYIDKYSMEHIINGQIDKFESHARFNLLSFDWHDINNPQELPSQIIIHFTKKTKASLIFRDAYIIEFFIFLDSSIISLACFLVISVTLTPPINLQISSILSFSLSFLIFVIVSF